MGWRNLKSFPVTSGVGWRAQRLGGDIITDKSIIDLEIKKWHPLDSLVVAAPGRKRLLPVLFVKQYSKAVHTLFVRRMKQVISFLSMLAMILVVSGVLFSRPNAVSSGIVAFALSLFYLIDYWLVGRRRYALAARQLFAIHVYKKGRTGLIIGFGIMLTAGIAQLVMQQYLGGFEPLMRKMGLVFDYVNSGELWRLLVGPFFHSGFVHWLVNLSMLAFAAPVTSVVSRYFGWAVFFVGNIVGVISVLVTSAYSNVDSYVGISSGIFAMLGWCAGNAWVRPEHFPPKFSLTITLFLLLAILIAWLMVAKASSEAHMAGLLLGLCVGMIIPAENKHSFVR